MTLYPYQIRKEIGQNMLSYIRCKGYTLTSISRISGISASTLHFMIEGKMSKHDHYHENMIKITESLNLPLTFFLEPPTMNRERWQITTTSSSSSTKRSELAQTLMDDLDELLSIAVFYIK
ncbi:XRE family transcriptional regulator [Psychrobacillus sp. MER TA 171]|uniref:XRE family transcriptional regulator n=1 Tax=Psychrobacillus sp. MER TA 171 TaxID=2939577 RepID=UPI00203F474A|nr:XRE family transcriptional regulator [Psychrobacillus sp. MER TA 171]MCM3359369.1 XRE family transcriptional regulator [Psychrobacillus sp. MER TA 171]